MQLVFNLIELKNTIAFYKNEVEKGRTPYYHGIEYDESVLDLSLTEIWVVYGPGLPKINGTYEYQKDYSKKTANEFCNFINTLLAAGHESARGNIRHALGIKDDTI